MPTTLEDEMIEEANEKALSKSKFPTFREYIDKIKEFYTKHSPFIYFKVKTLSPSKFQLLEAYYVKYDYDFDRDYMGKFKKTPHFIFNFKEQDFVRPLKTDELIEYDTIEHKITPVKQLPCRLF